MEGSPLDGQQSKGELLRRLVARCSRSSPIEAQSIAVKLDEPRRSRFFGA